MSYCDGDDPFKDARRKSRRPVWLGIGLGCSTLLLGVVLQLF